MLLRGWGLRLTGGAVLDAVVGDIPDRWTGLPINSESSLGYAPQVALSPNLIVALLLASDPRGCSTSPSGPGGPGGLRTLCMEGNSCHLVVIVCSCNSASSPTLDQIHTLMVPLWWEMGTQILKGFVALLGGEKSHGSKSLPSVSSSNSDGLSWLNVPSLNHTL